MKHLLKKKDGSIAIMTTTSDDIDPSAEFLKWGPEKAAEMAGHRPLVEGELPENRKFFAALRHKDDKVVVDMPAAIEIKKEHLRKEREPKLAALDVEYQRADEKGDVEAKRSIADKKQELRDVTSHERLLNARTLEELEAFEL